jgi:hypothetical protein
VRERIIDDRCGMMVRSSPRRKVSTSDQLDGVLSWTCIQQSCQRGGFELVRCAYIPVQSTCTVPDGRPSARAKMGLQTLSWLVGRPYSMLKKSLNLVAAETLPGTHLPPSRVCEYIVCVGRRACTAGVHVVVQTDEAQLCILRRLHMEARLTEVGYM